MHALTPVLFLVFVALHLCFATVEAATANAVSQIGDGQLQAPASGSSPAATASSAVSSSFPASSSSSTTFRTSTLKSTGRKIVTNSTSIASTPAGSIGTGTGIIGTGTGMGTVTQSSTLPSTVPTTVVETALVTLTVPCPSNTCPTVVVPSTLGPSAVSSAIISAVVSSIPISSVPAASSAPVPAPGAPAPAAPAPVAPASSTTPQQPSGTCPLELGSTYATPRVIALLDSTSPTKSSGPVYFPHISSTLSTVFTFDIPASYSGKTCTLSFGLPELNQLETSSFNLTGSGNIEIDKLSSAVQDGSVSTASVPSSVGSVGTFEVVTGESFEVEPAPCPAGTSESFVLKTTGGVDLEYFEDYNPCPIGLFVVAS